MDMGFCADIIAVGNYETTKHQRIRIRFTANGPPSSDGFARYDSGNGKER